MSSTSKPWRSAGLLGNNFLIILTCLLVRQTFNFFNLIFFIIWTCQLVNPSYYFFNQPYPHKTEFVWSPRLRLIGQAKYAETLVNYHSLTKPRSCGNSQWVHVAVICEEGNRTVFSFPDFTRFCLHLYQLTGLQLAPILTGVLLWQQVLGHSCQLKWKIPFDARF